MGAPCRVCTHPKRSDIEHDILVHGLGGTSLEKKYSGVSRSAFNRHRRHHMEERRRAAAEEWAAVLTELDSPAGIRAALRQVSFRLSELDQEARDLNDHKMQIAVLREMRETMKVSSQLLDRLDRLSPRSETNIQILVQSPEFGKLRGALMKALRRHPKAARDVAEVMAGFAPASPSGDLADVVEASPADAAPVPQLEAG